MKPVIQCKYTCSRCGIYQQIVTVPAREDEDVVTWLNEVAAAGISADHSRRSPQCTSRTMDELLIPVPEGTEKIGGLPGGKAA